MIQNEKGCAICGTPFLRLLHHIVIVNIMILSLWILVETDHYELFH